MQDVTVRDAYAIGEQYEAGLDEHARRQGAHFTPSAVAESLVARALVRWHGAGAPVVCDPACGGGAFLVAAAEHLRRSGASPARVVDELVVGVDVDPGAAAASRRALEVWASAHGVPTCRPRVVVADALAPGLDRLVGPVDVVVGNPPFRNQLGGGTARTAGERMAASARFGPAASGYVDVAALFQLVALELVGAGGIVTLIQPRSFLVARDTAPVRAALTAGGALREVWLPGEPVFAARVDVCATTVERSGDPGEVDVVGGRLGERRHPAVPAADLGATWSAAWASAQGIPVVATPAGARTIGDVAGATAGFRDQYYGLIPHLRTEAPADGARVVTTAMVDPAECTWANRPVTIARTPWTAPWLDRHALADADPRLAAWVDRLSVPKVLVATQTKVIEAVADPIGDLVPFTPVVAVVPHDIGVAHLEAALCAPAASAWAARRYGGAGMSPTSLKLAARQLLEIPLPVHREPWDAAVALLADGERDWPAIGRLLDASWGVDEQQLLAWWSDRLH